MSSNSCIHMILRGV